MNQKSKEALVVFDLDHTLLNCNSSVAFGKFLRQKGLLSAPRAFFLFFLYLLCKIRLLPLHILFNQSAFIADHQEYVPEFLENKLQGMLQPLLVEKLQLAKNHGQLTAILSASPKFLVEPIAKILGVDFCFASSTFLLRGADKADIIKSFIQQTNCQMTTAYSDSIEDLPLLQLVDLPIVVNPTLFLRAYARKKGWKFINT